jgi:preprotein translocase subunit SecD
MLVNAYVSYEQGLPVVAFRFNNQGARKFGDATKENVGKPFAIVLDDEVISAPVIREPILGGSGIISGGFTTESANDLALLLRAGALPAPIQVIEERTVGPSLGADSIAAGLKASLFGILLVATFMIVSYGLFGFFANVALVMNIVLVVGAMSLLQATLTLPGIAGIVLTMGMAVDTNVLIYERMREEVRLGKTPIAAIDQGFTQAFRTIFDAHVTTLIATVLLYAFGSGSVKGFAVTLAIGITSSLFTAVMFTRMIVVLWLRKFRPQKLPI